MRNRTSFQFVRPGHRQQVFDTDCDFNKMPPPELLPGGHWCSHDHRRKHEFKMTRPTRNRANTTTTLSGRALSGLALFSRSTNVRVQSNSIIFRNFHSSETLPATKLTLLWTRADRSPESSPSGGGGGGGIRGRRKRQPRLAFRG